MCNPAQASVQCLHNHLFQFRNDREITNGSDRHVYQHQRSPAKTKLHSLEIFLSPKYVPTSSPAPHPTPAPQLLQTPLGSLSMLQVSDLTATEERSERVLIDYRWPLGRVLCPEPGCGSADVRESRGYKYPNHLPVRFVCQTGGHRFTVRTNYFLDRSPLPFKTWVWALYIVLATLEHETPAPASLVRDLGVAEDTAHYILSRLRDHLQDIGPRPGPPQTTPGNASRKTLRPLHVTSTRRPQRTKPPGEKPPQ